VRFKLFSELEKTLTLPQNREEIEKNGCQLGIAHEQRSCRAVKIAHGTFFQLGNPQSRTCQTKSLPPKFIILIVFVDCLNCCPLPQARAVGAASSSMTLFIVNFQAQM